MPATMMHLAAGLRLHPQRNDFFYWGCILPDCVDHDRARKDELHFRSLPPEERLSALIAQGKKWDLKDDFSLGAFFHFYLDYLWDFGPQQAHRKSFQGEEWFPAYRKELRAAGSRMAQRTWENEALWQQLEKPDPALFSNPLDLPKEEIEEFLRFNAAWHRESRLEESPVFTDALVDRFLHRACLAFLRLMEDFFPEIACGLEERGFQTKR